MITQAEPTPHEFGAQKFSLVFGSIRADKFSYFAYFFLSLATVHIDQIY